MPDPAAKLLRPFILSMAAGILIYALAVIATDLEQVGAAIVRVDTGCWISLLGLSLLNYGLRFRRWQYYCHELGYRVPPFKNLQYYLAGFAFTATPGKAGETIRSLYLKRHGVRYLHSLGIFFVERFMDLLAIVLLAMMASFDFEDTRWPVIVAAGVILGALPLLHSDYPHRLVSGCRSVLKSKRLEKLGTHLQELLRHASRLLRSRSLYSGLGIGVVAWGAEGFAFYLLLENLGVECSVAMATGIYAIGILAGALSFIPGGLGSTEAVMGLLLVLIGVSSATAVAATLICRIVTLWFAVAIGFLAFARLESRRER